MVSQPQYAAEVSDKPGWSAPAIAVHDIEDVTEGDPTISDDGLGDGLFS